MAVPGPNDVPRINYWSNPDKTYGGVPMGTASDEDVVRVWENRASVLANFRTPSPPPPSPPFAPTSLQVTSQRPQDEGYPVKLDWDPSSSGDVVEYNVYRCVTPGQSSCSNWSLIITTSSTNANDYGYMFDGVDLGPQNVRAHYEVTAVDNDDLESPPSNETAAWVTPPSIQQADSTLSLRSQMETPEQFALEGNYPNPFNPSTEIRFALPEAASVELVVYDALGREVARLMDRSMEAGYHSVRWKAEDLPSGVYLYRLRASSFTKTKRMVLMK